ncbi:MAG: hypothetical protein QNJ97_10590 [Myxococcota bacterium]|nr:hypothetical protein [Myxococcota bacterium]
MTKSPDLTKIDFRLLFQAVRYRWKVVALFAVVVPAAMWLARDILPSKYRAQAELFVQNSVDVNPFLEDLRVDWSVNDRLPLIQSVIRSRETLEKVLRDIGELEEKADNKAIEFAISDLRSRITVLSMGGGLVRINVVGKSPDQCYDAITRLLDVAVDTMLRPQKDGLKEASQFLEKQIDEIRDELTGIEGAIQSFKEDNAAELPEVYQVNMTSYIDTKSALLRAKADLRAAQQRKSTLGARLRLYNPVARELESRLVQAQTQLGELRARYRDDHPEVVALLARINDLKKERKAANIESGALDMNELESMARLETEMRSQQSEGPSSVSQRSSDIMTSDLLEYRALLAEISSLRGEASALEHQSKETMESVKSFPATERTLQQLVRDKSVKESIYTNLLAKWEDARVTQALGIFDESNQIWLVEEPRRPVHPIGITFKWLFSLALVAGVLLGLIVAIIKEFLTLYVRGPGDVENLLGSPVIGVMPNLHRL